MTIERIQKKTHLSIFIHDPERGAGQDIHFNLYRKGHDPMEPGALKVLGIGLYPLMDIIYDPNDPENPNPNFKVFGKTNVYGSVTFSHAELPALIEDMEYIQTHAPKLYMQEFAQELKAMAEEALAIGGFINEDGV